MCEAPCGQKSFIGAGAQSKSRISTWRLQCGGISAFSPVQLGVVLSLPLLLVAQLQALERLHVVHVLQSFPVVFYYVSRERLHILLGAMESGARGRRDPAERGEDGDGWRGNQLEEEKDGQFREVKCGESQQGRNGTSHQTS